MICSSKRVSFGGTCAPTSVDCSTTLVVVKATAVVTSLKGQVSRPVARGKSQVVTRCTTSRARSSSERVASLISEGSEQSTDRHYAEYCYRSKGSARETRTQLVVAVQRGHI